jgi:NADH-quinone oxidoreductase subunit J
VDAILFYVFGAFALAGAVVVVAQRNPLYSAFALVVVLCSLSGIYALLEAPFIAVLQIIVYAGAIMVLFLFVLMLLNVRREDRRPETRTLKIVALGLVVLLVVQVGAVLTAAGLPAGTAPLDGSVAGVARTLFSREYLYVFEATSVLILSALVGAVALAKKDL